jgi:hypothetical protein
MIVEADTGNIQNMIFWQFSGSNATVSAGIHPFPNFTVPSFTYSPGDRFAVTWDSVNVTFYYNQTVLSVVNAKNDSIFNITIVSSGCKYIFGKVV